MAGVGEDSKPDLRRENRSFERHSAKQDADRQKFPVTVFCTPGRSDLVGNHTDFLQQLAASDRRGQLRDLVLPRTAKFRLSYELTLIVNRSLVALGYMTGHVMLCHTVLIL